MAIRISSSTHNIKHIHAFGNIQTQYIVSSNIRGHEYIWNFNGDINDDIIGKFNSSTGFIKMFGVEPNIWYKRTIYDDHIKIYPMTNQEVNTYLEEQKKLIKTNK